MVAGRTVGAAIAGLALVAITAAGCAPGKVIRRTVVWNCPEIITNARCDWSVTGPKTTHWLIEVQLDATDVGSVEWDDVSPAVYNRCFVGARYPDCRGSS